MSEYLLLRNNKQSGPYSLEEIRAMGLKAYDLVWIEGKSAAWRYPGEIDELKSFAPAVEEQPYDRFFKKPSENKPVSLTQEAPAQARAEEYRAAATVREPAIQIRPKNDHAAAIVSEPAVAAVHETISQPARPIYVTMPAGKKNVPEKEIAAVPEKKQFAQERPKITENPEPKTFARSLPLMAHELPNADENFLQPADNTRNHQAGQAAIRSKRISFPDLSGLIRPATIAFGLISLIALGVVIGLLISGRGINTPKNIPSTLAEVRGQQTAYKTPVKTAPVSAQIQESGQPAIDKDALQTDLPADRKQETAVIEKKKTKAAKTPAADSTVIAKNPATDSKDTEALTAHRETARKADAPDARESIKNNITDYVSVSAGKYTVGTFGGISDLQLTVSNTSAYPLDLVLVEVRYIQSNKKTFKTENIYFHDIAAGSAIMEEAPKSSRGIKVQYRITLINSKELGLSYSDL